MISFQEFRENLVEFQIAKSTVAKSPTQRRMERRKKMLGGGRQKEKLEIKPKEPNFFELWVAPCDSHTSSIKIIFLLSRTSKKISKVLDNRFADSKNTCGIPLRLISAATFFLAEMGFGRKP